MFNLLPNNKACEISFKKMNNFIGAIFTVFDMLTRKFVWITKKLNLTLTLLMGVSGANLVVLWFALKGLAVPTTLK
jgi:hypothetical protein